MASFLPHPPDGRIEASDLRTVLEGCRAELVTVGRRATDGAPSADDRLADLEDRLRRLSTHLERAAWALDRAIVAVTPSFESSATEMAMEADHRIKNSLGLLAAILRRQARESAAEAGGDALLAAAGRVEAVASVHASLYLAARRGVASPELDLDDYLSDLLGTLRDAIVDGAGPVLRVSLEPLVLPPETVRRLGLVVAELVTNAFRHAFPLGRRGTVRVTGRGRPDGRYEIRVADDGKGLPPGFDIRLPGVGLGMRLVRVLADEAGARLSVTRRGGTCFVLILPGPITETKGPRR